MFGKTTIFTLATLSMVVCHTKHDNALFKLLTRGKRSSFFGACTRYNSGGGGGAFGSVSHFPEGGFSQTAGVQGGPFSASVSQNFNARGQGGAQTFSAGANFVNPDTGSGVNFGLSKTPSAGGSATAGASVNLHHTPNSNLNVVGQHTQVFDKNWNNLGQSNSVGLQYQNKDTSVGVSATRVDPVFGKSETQVGVNFEKQF